MQSWSLGRVTVDSEIRFGKPCITGTRLTVEEIVGWLSAGKAVFDVLTLYPQLTEEDLRACVVYMAERRKLLQIATP